MTIVKTPLTQFDHPFVATKDGPETALQLLEHANFAFIVTGRRRFGTHIPDTRYSFVGQLNQTATPATFADWFSHHGFVKTPLNSASSVSILSNALAYRKENVTVVIFDSQVDQNRVLVQLGRMDRDLSIAQFLKDCNVEQEKLIWDYMLRPGAQS